MYFIYRASLLNQLVFSGDSFNLELSSSGMAYAMCDCALCWKGADISSRGRLYFTLPC